MLPLPTIEEYKNKLKFVPRDSYILAQAKENLLTGLAVAGSDEGCKKHLLDLYAVVDQHHLEDLSKVVKH